MSTHKQRTANRANALKSTGPKSEEGKSASRMNALKSRLKKALEEKERLVLPVYVDKMESWRLTLTPLALNSAERVLFLVQGQSKAEAVSHVFETSYDPLRWPAQVVNPENGQVEWFMDETAAGQLDF
jgi:6-phosphogluconolactonase/glucosamine-6-phosphate isomerase/deaminase